MSNGCLMHWNFPLFILCSLSLVTPATGSLICTFTIIRGCEMLSVSGNNLLCLQIQYPTYTVSKLWWMWDLIDICCVPFESPPIWLLQSLTQIRNCVHEMICIKKNLPKLRRHNGLYIIPLWCAWPQLTLMPRGVFWYYWGLIREQWLSRIGDKRRNSLFDFFPPGLASDCQNIGSRSLTRVLPKIREKGERRGSVTWGRSWEGASKIKWIKMMSLLTVTF